MIKINKYECILEIQDILKLFQGAIVLDGVSILSEGNTNLFGKQLDKITIWHRNIILILKDEIEEDEISSLIKIYPSANFIGFDCSHSANFYVSKKPSNIRGHYSENIHFNEQFQEFLETYIFFHVGDNIGIKVKISENNFSYFKMKYL